MAPESVSLKCILRSATTVPALLLALLSVGAGQPDAVAGEKRLQVMAKPTYTLEPGRVTITVRHYPHRDDRQMTIEADSGDFFRSSTFPLEGDRARTLHDVTLTALPAGEYRVRVMIDRRDREKVEISSRFLVCRSSDGDRSHRCELGGAAERATGTVETPAVMADL